VFQLPSSGNLARGENTPENNKKDGSCRHAIFTEFIIIHLKKKKARVSWDDPGKYSVIQVVILQPPGFTNV
jgi:hypothetical protein